MIEENVVHRGHEILLSNKNVDRQLIHAISWMNPRRNMFKAKTSPKKLHSVPLHLYNIFEI
jgi:hypothetical protein